MKLLRKTIFWIHLAVGVIAGLIILLMSATGVMLTYEKQITYWADTRNYQSSSPVAGASRLPVETLLAKARDAQPQSPVVSILQRADAAAPTAIGFTGNRTVFYNSYTGDALGEGSKGARSFFRFVTDWHRWLGMEGASRATGRAVTGISNLVFLFIVVSGLYLWWPRKQTWQQFKNILWFRRGLPGKARDFNWHNVIGFWSFVPLFAIVLSGVVISYQWAGNLVYRAVGETPPAPAPAAPRAGEGQPRGNNSSPSSAPTFDGLNQLWARAEQQTPDWRSISLRLPGSSEAPIAFSIDRGTGGEPQKRGTLTLNRKTGEVIRWEPFSDLSNGRKLRSILRFAHTGEVGGIVGQTIAGLVSLGGCFLVYTGLALAWRRFWAWRGRRSSAVVPARASANLEQV